MPNLKDIKQRIGSVQNTKKITKAMKMVAAAKVKKAENTVKAARPFSDVRQNRPARRGGRTPDSAFGARRGHDRRTGRKTSHSRIGRFLRCWL